MNNAGAKSVVVTNSLNIPDSTKKSIRNFEEVDFAPAFVNEMQELFV